MKLPMINVSLQRYGTRRLKAGDTFDAHRRDARVLDALKKARFPTEDDEAAASAGAALTALRAQYQEKFGKKPYHGWTVEELATKISAGSADD